MIHYFLVLWIIVLYICLLKRVKSYFRSILWYFYSYHIVLFNIIRMRRNFFAYFLNEIFFAEWDFLNLQRIWNIKCSFILWNVVKSKFKKKFLHMFSWACYSSRGLDCNPTVSLTLSLINVMTRKITNTF